MKKKKLKAKIRKLEMQVIEARTSAVGTHIAKASGRARRVERRLGGIDADAGDDSCWAQCDPSKKPQRAASPRFIGKASPHGRSRSGEGKVRAVNLFPYQSAASAIVAASKLAKYNVFDPGLGKSVHGASTWRRGSTLEGF